jgi:hypothetical protein
MSGFPLFSLLMPTPSSGRLHLRQRHFRLIVVTNGYVERVRGRNVDVIRRRFNLQEYSNEKNASTLV